jgi:hypothetical protein
MVSLQEALLKSPLPPQDKEFTRTLARHLVIDLAQCRLLQMEYRWKEDSTASVAKQLVADAVHS